jgi:hypothetical protein
MRDVLAELGPVPILAMFALISAASKLLRSAKSHSFFAIRRAARGTQAQIAALPFAWQANANDSS